MEFDNNNEVKLIENLVWSFFKWILIALLTGSIGGIIGSIFNLAVRYATGFREMNPWLIWLLPAGGALIALMYSVSKMEHENTDSIIDSIREGTRAPILLTPCIFIATLITHFCGGSAGREGAALQIGGSIGANVASLLHLDDKDLRLATLCGMSAVFSALFGTPVTAALFALEFISVGIFYYSGLIPCLVSAITAFGFNKLFHIPATQFHVPLESLSLDMLWRVAILAVFCAVISTTFCFLVQYTAAFARRRCPNTYLRAVIGGVIIIGLTYLVGCTDYNGTGQTQLLNALESGVAKPSAFFWKILFTAITLGCGFRGGPGFVYQFPQSRFRHVVSAGGAHLRTVEHFHGRGIVENSPHQLELAAFQIQLLLFRLVQKIAVFFNLLFPENTVQEIGSCSLIHLICLLS